MPRVLSRAQKSYSRRSIGYASQLVVESLEARRLLSTSVLTYHNDTTNSGVNSTETALTPTNVKVGSFGKLFATTLDGQVYAQPLVDAGVTINGSTVNAVFVATENDSLYAINGTTGQILWQRSFTTLSNSSGILNNTLGATSITTVLATDVNTQDINPTIGITGTPVVDSSRNLIYLVAKTKEVIGGTTYFVQRLHAINISNGTDATTPFLIGKTSGTNSNSTSIYVYGTGDGSVTDPYNGTGKQVVQFNALTENQRAALTLVNNTVYVAWASHGDNGPYHGWVAAWSVANVTTSGFTLTGVLNTSPNDGEAGIWQGGSGLVFEPNGSAFYFLTGNGTGGAPTDGSNGLPTDADYNEALVKAQADPTTSPTNQNPNGWGLKIVSSFTPYNVAALDGADSDFGSGAPILLPNPVTINGVATNLIVAGGKDGRLFVLNRNNLGGYNATTDAALNDVSNGAGDLTPPVQDAGTLSSPAFFNGNLYVDSGYSGAAYEFSISSTGALQTVSQSPITLGYEPGSPSISASGTSNGIVWITDRNTNELHAYSAASLNNELWNSAQAAGGADDPGAVVKFAVPTVANGEVFMGTTSQLVAYGLTPAATSVSNAPVLAATTLSGSAVNLTWTDSSVPPNIASAYLIEESTDGTNFTQITTAPAGATSIGVGGLSASTKYYFRIQGYNNIGDSNFSNVATATTSTQSAGINFGSGFGSAGGSMAVNGNASISGSNLQLTDGNLWEGGSAFDTTAVDVTSFTSQFTIQLSAGANTADGMTFTLQNLSPNALGTNAGSLGYAGIGSSVAIKFDLYSNNGEGPDSTGFYSNGAAPTNLNSIDLSSTGINLHSGDPIQVNLSYNGTVLTVSELDTVTKGTASQSYTVNIPNLIGSGTAYAGFTGGSGGLGCVQDVQNWTYNAGSGSTPNAPTGLGATPATATSVTLNWTNNALNASGFYLDRATNSNFTQGLITQTLPGGSTTYTDTAAGLAAGSTFYYRIRAFNGVGSSGNSNSASVTIPQSPPKATNQAITGVATNEIDMTWQDNAGHAALGYHILRATNQGTFSLVATLPPTSRTAPSTYSWADTTVTPGNYYEYHIEAYNTSGYNDFAGVNATALTLAPSGVSAVQSTNGTTVSWSAPSAFGALTYNIYRATTPGGEGSTPLYTGITATSYLDATATPGTTYYYQITAVNTNATYPPPLPGESVRSAEASTNGTSATSGQLTGTPSANTTGSYNNVAADNYLAAFDGNINTFFDAPAANGNWIQLNLPAAQNITSIEYAPRAGFEYRMTGGIFEVSNDPTFNTGVVTLFTINNTPGDGLTTQTVSPGAPYEYIRYLSPAGSYGNIAEMQVFGSGSGTTSATPVVTTPPSAIFSPAGNTAALSVAAAESGNPALTYTWSTVTLPVGDSTPPTFSSSNGSTTGNNTTATFFSSGTYQLQVTITDPTSHSLVVPFTVTVNQVFTSITITPTAVPVSVPAGGTIDFSASGNDQFDDTLDTQPTFTWALTAGAGSIASTTGVYTASTTVGSTATITASATGALGTIVGGAMIKTIAGTTTTVQLTGTPSASTTASYNNIAGTNYLAAFDGNTNTFFDAPTADGNWIQLNLGSPLSITQIAYAPRAGFEYRVPGGIFEASNDPTFSTGVVTLYTVSATPGDALTTHAVTPGGTYQYVRYVSPAGSYGNIAEMQVFGPSGQATPPSAPGTPTLTASTSSTVSIAWPASGSSSVTGYIVLRNGTQVGTTNSSTLTYTDTGLSASTTYTYTVEAAANTLDSAPSAPLAVTTPAGSTTTPVQLSGTPSANTTTSYGNAAGATYTAAFDGNTNTYFDAPTANGNWIQWNLPSAEQITAIAYAPRAGFEYRMQGGVFEVSNDPTFTTGVVTLFTINAAPADGLTTQTVSPGANYQYIRYVSPAGSYGNIAEMQVFGPSGQATPPSAPGTPTLAGSTSSTVSIAWTASTSAGITGYIVLRNGTQVGTTNSTTLTYTDTGLSASTAYTYKIEAVASTLDSAPSGALAVTTPAATPTQLTGTPSASTTGSYANDGDTYIDAFDGNTNTFFDSPNASGNWIQLNLGAQHTITSIAYAPRAGFEYRMLGGYFEASNDPTFSTGVVTLYTITTTPPDGLTTQTITVPGTYQYVRYIPPAGSYGNIAEMQVFGI